MERELQGTFFFFFFLSLSIARFSSSFSPIDTELWVLIEKHTWKKKQRGKREEKKKKRGILAAEISGIVICSITNHRERGMGGILLTNHRHWGFYVVISGALNLSCFSINHKMICWLMDYNMPPCLGTWRKERREKGKGRLQVTMNWISGTLMDAFEVFLKMSQWAFGCVFVICLLV